MKVQKISFENYKCFDKVNISFGKLTLLTGQNSSGKSSIISGLLAPIQSDKFPYIFSINGKYLNMGSFIEIANSHNFKKTLKLGYEINDNNEIINIDTFWINDKLTKQPKLKRLMAKSKIFNLEIELKIEKYHLKFNYLEKFDKNAIKANIKLELMKKTFETIFHNRQVTNKLNSKSTKNKEKSSQNIDYSEIISDYEKKLKLNNQEINIIFDSFDNLDAIIFKNASESLDTIFKKLKSYFISYGVNTNYISSFRFYPPRLRNEIVKSDLTVGRYGENFEDQILAWQTKKDDKLSKMIIALKELKLLYDLKISRVDSGHYQVKVKTHKGGVFSNLYDVGFGISQFLPIVVSDFQLGDGSNLIISQPEIHLHPKLQSDFGDYLINQINSKNKSYIIETHSEYLINKIRLLIVQGKIKKEDVCVYYFTKNGDISKTDIINFEEDGRILNAPKDFFDTYMTDVMEIALGMN
jgi:predicted ATPase